MVCIADIISENLIFIIINNRFSDEQDLIRLRDDKFESTEYVL